MKQIYTLSFLAFLLLGAGCLHAQDIPWSFGVRAGVNMSGALTNNRVADSKFRAGYQVGVTAEYAFSPVFSLRSGLSYTVKGSNIHNLLEGLLIQGAGTDENHVFEQQYLQLPLYAVYKIALGNDTRFVLNAGPYFALGTGGKSKRTLHGAVFEDGSHQQKYDTFGKGKGIDEQLKKVDFGIGFGVGYELKRYIIVLGYEIGMLDISQAEIYSYRNSSASLTVGYQF